MNFVKAGTVYAFFPILYNKPNRVSDLKQVLHKKKKLVSEWMTMLAETFDWKLASLIFTTFYFYNDLWKHVLIRPIL